MEYTEQEIEMLFGAVMDGASDVERNTPTLRSEIKFSVELILNGLVGRRASPAPYTLDLPAALRLMREAREQGAADMRGRAALIARDNGGDVLDIDRLIRALPLTPTTDDAKASKLARLRRELSDAGDRRDSDECDRIDAEIEAVERSGQ